MAAFFERVGLKIIVIPIVGIGFRVIIMVIRLCSLLLLLLLLLLLQ